MQLRDLVAWHDSKLPEGFHDRLAYALNSGQLSVMVTVSQRSQDVEAVTAAGTDWVSWYNDLPAYWALVTPDQFGALLQDPNVVFIDPDYPLTYFMAVATIADNARSTGSGTGVWKYDVSTDSFKSDITTGGTPYTGLGVTVAVVDSGIDQTFQDFSSMGCTSSLPFTPCNSRIKAAVKVIDEVGFDSGLYPTTYLPTTDFASAHGTHVSGSVAGNAYYSRELGAISFGGDGYQFGVAPEASLVSVSNGEVNSAALASQALAWVDRNAATFDIKVTSNSWGCLGGCPYDAASATSVLFKALYNKGIVSAVAAGNDGGAGSGSGFSGYGQSPYVLSVAAYDDSTNRVASFSSRGSSAAAHNSLATASTWTPESEVADPANPTEYSRRRPDLAAPGVDIISARSLTGGYASGVGRVNAGDVGQSAATPLSPYATMSGTSMATPQVAGAAAVLFHACPSATALEVMRALMDGAASGLTKSTGSSAAEAFEVGYGALDVRAAVDSLQSTLASC